MVFRNFKTTFTKRVIISFSFAQDLIDDQQWSCVNETLWWTSREWKNHCPNTENIWQGLRFDDWNIIIKTPRQEKLSDRTGQVRTKVYHPKPTPKLNSPELGLPSLSKQNSCIAKKWNEKNLEEFSLGLYTWLWLTTENRRSWWWWSSQL